MKDDRKADMTDETHNGASEVVAPWELRRREEGYATNEYSMVSMRLRKALAARIDNMAGYLGTNRSQFMRHAVLKLLAEEENKWKLEETDHEG